jgi:hypothetical protein
VLPEVVSQVAALSEDSVAALVTTLKVELDSHGLRIAYFYCLVPAVRDALKDLLSRVNAHNRSLPTLLARLFNY